MAILTNLFGESPFGALEEHGKKVHECVRLLRNLLPAVEERRQEDVRSIAEQIFARETEADKIRNHVHELLSAKVLLPLRKEELFNILEQQDSMADRAEDIAAILTYRDMHLPEDLMAEVDAYLKKILNNCELAAGIMSKFDLLVESSFSGLDAVTVSKLITELSEREDSIKSVQVELSRKLLAAEERISPVEVMLWLQVLGFIGELSKFADRTANGIRMTLQIKHTK